MKDNAAGKLHKTSHTSAVHYNLKRDGEFVIHSCGGLERDCSHYIFPICTKTGEMIPYPITGPVGYRCPLPHHEEKAE
jgi:hypothetical protein